MIVPSAPMLNVPADPPRVARSSAARASSSCSNCMRASRPTMLGISGEVRYREIVPFSRGPISGAMRRIDTAMSGRRRPRPRAYPSMSIESRAYAPLGGRRALISSVNFAGSFALQPYTEDDERRTTRSTVGDFWQTANNCIAPMTLRSFIVARPPDFGGLATVAACTTVSTPALRITLPISGLRMSARTNSARPMRRSRSLLGDTASTAMTRSMFGFWASLVTR